MKGEGIGGGVGGSKYRRGCTPQQRGGGGDWGSEQGRKGPYLAQAAPDSDCGVNLILTFVDLILAFGRMLPYAILYGAKP